MIAPLPRANPPRRRSAPGLRRARRWVASRLLAEDSSAERNAPPIAAWKAWLFVGWVFLVAAVYFASMLGLLK